MNLSVGADIEDRCSKCGEVWHVIVAKVGDKIAKVQCKICLGSHRYRSGASATAPRKRTPKEKSPYSTKPAAPDLRVEPNMDKPVRTYSVRDQFVAGDRVQHPKFGLGIVEGSPGPGKMFVRFDEVDRRVLAMAKPGAKLQRPPRRIATDNAD